MKEKSLCALLLIILTLLSCSNSPRESKAAEVAAQLANSASQTPSTPPAPIASPLPVLPVTSPATIVTNYSSDQKTREMPIAPEALPNSSAEQKTEENTPAQTIHELPATPANYSLDGVGVIQSYLNLFSSQVKSYKFILGQDNYYTRGTRFKVILENPIAARNVVFLNGTTKRTFYYDTVYVDRVAKNALGYCEGHTDKINRECTQLQIQDLAYPVPFDKYNVILPEDWLFSYLSAIPNQVEKNKYYLRGRQLTLVSIPLTNYTLKLSFDPDSGLVLRADKFHEDVLFDRTDYERVASNTVRDVDVIHRPKNQIPSEELFFRPQ